MIQSKDIINRLKSLGQKSQFNQNNARIIASGNPDENVKALLQEINETILARTLEFQTDTGAKLGLDVIGRRVLHISSLQMPNRDGPRPPIGELLSEGDHLEQFVQTISLFAGNANELSVIASTPDQAFDTSAVGLRAGRLLKSIPESIKAEEPATKTGSMAIGILKSIQGITDWLIIKGADAGENSGDTKTVAKLKEVAETNNEKLDSYLDQFSANPKGPVASVVGVLSGNSDSILCFRINEQLVLAVVSSEAIPSIINKWHNLHN